MHINTDGHPTFYGQMAIHHNAPFIKLKDNTSAGGTFQAYLVGEDSVGTVRWRMGRFDASHDDVEITNVSGSDIKFLTNNAEAARILSSGNVSIGTSANQSNLTVQGGHNTDGNLSYNLNLCNTVNKSSGTGSGLAFGFNIGTSSNNLITACAGIEGYAENATNNDYASRLGFFTRANGAALTEQLTIASTGDATFAGSVTSSAGLLTPSRTLLQTVTIDDDTSFDIGDPSGAGHITDDYFKYELELDHVLVGTDTAIMQVTFLTGSTPTEQTLNYHFRSNARTTHSGASAGAYASTSHSFITWTGNLSNVAAEAVSGYIWLVAPGKTDRYAGLQSEYMGRTGQGTNTPQCFYYGGGSWLGGTDAITGLRFRLNTGNYASGTIRLYGVS